MANEKKMKIKRHSMKYRSMEQNRKPRDKSTHLWTPYFDKGARLYNGEKTVSSGSGGGKTGQLHEKE